MQVDRASSSDSSLWDLIERKPHRLDNKAGDDYMDEFGRHPSIQSINLNAPEHTRPVHQLIRLSSGAKDTKQGHKLHALIDHHLERARADPMLIATYKGQRFRQRRRRRNRKSRVAQINRDPVGFKNKAKESRQKTKVNLAQRGPVKELSEFLGDSLPRPRMTAVQVAEMARKYRSEYGPEVSYTMALKRYLKKNKFSPQDIDAATGWSAWQVNNEKRRTLPGTAQGVLGAGLTSRNMKWIPDVSADRDSGQTQQKKQTDPPWTKVPRRARTAEIHYPPKPAEVVTSPAHEVIMPETHFPAPRVMPEDWWKPHHL